MGGDGNSGPPAHSFDTEAQKCDMLVLAIVPYIANSKVIWGELLKV